MQKIGKLFTVVVLMVALVSIISVLFFGSVTGYQVKDLESLKSKPKLDCVDDDNNPLVKGGVTFNGVFYTDKCMSSGSSWQQNNVEEMTCNPIMGIEAKVIPCPESYYCDYTAGACVEESKELPVEDKTGCFDTDLENDPRYSGDVILFRSDGTISKKVSDVCQGTTKTKEQTCKGKQLGEPIIKSCPKNKKCSRGRCS